MIKPYYEEPGITIYHGDCRDILPHLPKVDLVLTDPNYGLGIAKNPFRQKHEKMNWDNEVCSPELINACLLAGDTIIVWGGNYFNLPPTQCFLVWDKKQPEEFSSAMVELAWTNMKKPAKLFQRWVVTYKKWHPTQKPIELMKWCILQDSQPQTILDPFMGSGTTLVAAKQLNRKAIGIEIEQKYCDIAIDRLRQEVFDFA